MLTGLSADASLDNSLIRTLKASAAWVAFLATMTDGSRHASACFNQ